MTEKTIFERLMESAENQKRLTSSTEYFDWIYEFTKKHRKFTDTDWLYRKDPNMSEHDYAQVELLTDFFTAIDQYHTKNFLEANSEGYACWYNIKYKDTYFAIGICVGQGSYNFVTRYESYDKMLPEPFIDFDYILKDKFAPGFGRKLSKLQELEELLDEMKDMRTPKYAIQSVLDKVFK